MKLTSRSPRRRLETPISPPRRLLPAVTLPRLRVLATAGIAAVVVTLITVSLVSVPKGPSDAEVLADYIDDHAQSLAVSPQASITVVPRDAYTATPGIDSLKASGTNYDFAKLVML